MQYGILEDGFYAGAFVPGRDDTFTTQFYPTPPESDGGHDSHSMASSPTFQGLTQSPTPMFYEYSYPSPTSEQSFEMPVGENIKEISEGNADANYGEDQVLSISTSFYPGSHSLQSDIVISSTDGTLFYVNSTIIAKASTSAVSTLLQFSAVPCVSVEDAGVLPVPLTASVLNIVFHAIYGTSCAQNSPELDDIIAAVDTMPVLGLDLATAVRPHTPLYTVLLSHGPLRPMEVYALAARHNLPELAEQVSAYLLSYPLETMTDAMAARIGSSYLKRLFLLHMSRAEAVKEVLMQPPGYHPTRKRCSFEDQKKVTRAWALGSTHLAWDMKADLTTQRIQAVFEPLCEEISCKDCKEMLQKRIREAVVKWASVKRTI